ncbi:unnamed protein product [Symbiodinium microadriaticum]|nr:unnamed protein product [Symbiodinium microadriaticum]CAE7938477.1 unnamed protein product [Symbiodinium sp. KB8]
MNLALGNACAEQLGVIHHRQKQHGQQNVIELQQQPLLFFCNLVHGDSVLWRVEEAEEDVEHRIVRLPTIPLDEEGKGHRKKSATHCLATFGRAYDAHACTHFEVSLPLQQELK